MPSSITFTVTIPDLQPSHWQPILGDYLVPSKVQAIDIQNIIINAKLLARRLQKDIIHTQQILERIIINAELLVRRLEKDIIHIKQILERLQKRRDELHAEACAHQAFLSPIRRLPDEILGEVFRAYCYSGSHDMPLFLGTICHRWRVLSLSMPDLWSRIVIKYPVSPTKYAMTACFLERSQEVPLNMTIENQFGGYNEIWSNTLEIVRFSCERWSKLELCLHSRSNDWSCLKSKFPTLQILTMRQPIGLKIPELFEVAPTLHSVHLFSWKYAKDLRLPWHQLTVFSYIAEGSNPSYVWSLEDGLYILGACPQLVSCTFGGLGLWGTPESQIPHVHHERLEYLQIQIHSIGDLSIVFESLTLPSLQDLKLSKWHPRIGEMIENDGLMSFKDLISRSSCHPQKLLLPLHATVPISISDLIACLEKMPELLELQFKSNFDSLTQLMGPNEGTPLLLSLCPRIRWVRCTVYHSNRDDVISLEASIRSQIHDVVLSVTC